MDPARLLIYLAITNLLVGVSFTAIGGFVLFLFMTRHKDWPRAWVLLGISAALVSCGVSRIVHSAFYWEFPTVAPDVLIVGDTLAAVVSIVTMVLCPWGIYALSKLPTIAQWEHTLRNAEAKKAAEAYAKWQESQREKMERSARILLAVFNNAPSLPADLKDEVNTLLRELPDGSIPGTVV